MRKWIKRICVGILILTALVIVAVNIGMSSMKFTDLDAKSYFDERGFEGIIDSMVVGDVQVKIVSDMPQKSDSILLVFVHGAPGTWDAYKDYITDKDFYSRARVVAYDRPGYGGSGNQAMPSIQEQSQVLKAVVNRYGLKRNILVGHSYGGPIVGAAGIDLKSDAVIMIAPLVDPENEPLFWYSYFSYWRLTSWLLPPELVVAGSEKFAHASELEKLQSKWKEAERDIVHIHGLKDGLAPGKENIAFSNNEIPRDHLRKIVYEDKGHLLIWTDYTLMKDEILKAIDNL